LIGYKETASPLVFVGARRFDWRAPCYALPSMSDLKSRVIMICMLVGALTMIGLALSGTLQMSRLPVAQVATK
jgi:hypothetical protein